MSTRTNDNDHCILPLEHPVHDRDSNKHNKDECCRLISFEVTVDLCSPIKLELGVKIQIRFLVSLESIKRH